MASKKKVTKKKLTKKAPAKKKVAPKKKAAKKKAGKEVAKSFDLAKHVLPRSVKHADATELLARFERCIEDPTVELRHGSPFELVIATILAAQSTDRTVNQVMPKLLARYPDATALAAAEQEDVEQLVLSTGFFRNKAKAIRATSQALVDRHAGEVPNTMEELVALPGVARKTANVVLSSAFNIGAGFITDTHVMRVSQRLALTRHTEPGKIEQDLCATFPRSSWVELPHRFTLHGRYTCLAREPMCADCGLNELCPSRQAAPADSWTERAERGSERAKAGVRASRGN
ncbi:MAG TPA: endonuclease III [Polyangiales bacterium]|nr:endonuclease III [Polyangiales bacterium]